MNKEEVQLVASTLRFELDEPRRAKAIEDATHFFVHSPAAGRLFDALLRGDWPKVTQLAVDVISDELLDAALFEIESCQVIETLATQGGAAAMRVIRKSARPQHASQLGLILFSSPKNAENLRQRLYRRLRTMLGPEHTVPIGRLRPLLHLAVKFRQLDELQGDLKVQLPPLDLANDALLNAYITETALFLSLNSSVDSLADLRTICGMADNLNIFGTEEVNNKIQFVITQALEKDPDATIDVLRQRASCSDDLIGQLFASSLTKTNNVSKGITASSYNYFEHYENRRTADMPTLSSALQLGQIVEAALNQYTLRVPKQSLFLPIKDDWKQFPSHIVKRLRHESEVWVVSFSPNGSLLAVGCADGSVVLYKVEESPLTIVKMRSLRLSHGIQRLLWHTSNGRLLAGDMLGYSVVWNTSTDTEVPILARHGAEKSTTGGDMCWHPTNPDFFFRAEWDHTISMRHVNGKEVKWWFSLGSPLQSVTTTAGKQLAVLTAKTDGVPQRIFVLDDYDCPTTVEEYDQLPESAMYSSLQSSSWDPRTLLLMTSQRTVMLMDIMGKRDTRLLHGPLQNECIIRPCFAGPLDKYVLCGSEETQPSVSWVINRFTGDVVARYDDHEAIVNSMSLRIGESVPLLATGSDDMDVIIYSRET